MSDISEEQVESDAGRIGARLDRLPILTSTQRLWIAVLAGFYVFDVVDLALVAYTAAAWRLGLGVTVEQIGVITSATFAGMIVGGLVGGRLADRFGRRPVVLASCTIMSLGSLATAFSDGFLGLAASRFVTGLGVQAMAATILVLAAESLPAARRGRGAATIVGVGVTAGPVVAFLSTAIVPLSEDSWRWMYVLGALGLVIVLAAGRRVPESPRWLIANGRVAEADRIVERLETEALRRTGAPLPEVLPAPRAEALPLRRLFRRGYRGPLSVGMLTVSCFVLMQYGFTSWITIFLVDRGYTQAEALQYSTAIAVVGAISAVSTPLFIDRWARRRLLSSLATVAAGLSVVFAFAGAPWLFFAVGLLMIAAINAIMVVAYTYVPELFPTGLRGVGSGASHGTGRLAGIGGSLLVPLLYASGGFQAVYLYVAAVGVVLAVVLNLVGSRVADRAVG